jgi:hypothetical protein
MTSISTLFGSQNAIGNLIAHKSKQQDASGVKTLAQAKELIGASENLSAKDKTSLGNLATTVDAFAKGNDKLLRDVVGISNLLQLNHSEKQASVLGVDETSFTQALGNYYKAKIGAKLDLKA